MGSGRAFGNKVKVDFRLRVAELGWEWLFLEAAGIRLHAAHHTGRFKLSCFYGWHIYRYHGGWLSSEGPVFQSRGRSRLGGGSHTDVAWICKLEYRGSV